jgi:hypothetical protein
MEPFGSQQRFIYLIARIKIMIHPSKCVVLEIFLAAGILISGPQIGIAELVMTFVTSTLSQSAFPISAVDLANIGMPSFGSIESTGNTASVVDQYGPVSALVDGNDGGSTGFQPSPGGVMDIDGNWTVQVNLILTIASHGYDIASVVTYTGP